MISKSVDILRRNLPFYIGYAIVLGIVRQLEEVALEGFVPLNFVAVPTILLVTFLQAALAQHIFRTALYGISFAELPPRGSRFGGLFELCVKAAILFAISTIPSLIFFIWAKHLGLVPVPRAPDLRIALALIAITALCSSAVFSYAGTWLPASVYNGDLSFGAALTRGNKTFQATFLPLTLATLFLNCLSFSLSYTAKIWDLPPSNSGLDHVFLGGTLRSLAALVDAFYMTFAAVVLSHQYLRSEISKEEVSQPVADLT